MKKVLSFICFVVGICIISITGNGCKGRNQNQVNDSVVSESPTDESSTDELSQFREKFNIKNILNLLDNPKNKSLAQKCGLEYIYEEEYKEEYQGGEDDCFKVFYGYDVERGNKNDYGYDINASSQHAVYLNYVESFDMGWFVYFKSEEDADYFISDAKKHGFTKKKLCYTNGNWDISFALEDKSDKWFYFSIQASSPGEFDEGTEKSNFNNDMSESNNQTTSSSEARLFRNEDDVYMNFVSQTFVDNSGLKIRFGGNGEMEIDGDYAGIARVKSYNLQRAILKYSGGVYGEGFIILSIEGGTAKLFDPNDPSTVWYRKGTF